MMSESLRGAVFNAFSEAKLSVEVELGDPSVIDVLSRTSEVIGVSQIEYIEERFLLELRQEKEENIADYARRVASVCFERRIQLTDQKSLFIDEIRTGSVAVLNWKGAECREKKVMAVDRVDAYIAKMTPEMCSSIMMPIQETLMRKNEAAELSLVFNVSPGEAIVQRVWVEYDVEMTVQMNHINWPERGLIESAVIRLNREAAAADFEQMSAERTTLSREGCSFVLEVPMELSQRTYETWEVESGKCSTQEVECVFKPTEALAGFKLDYVKQDNQNGMHVQKTEAERPSHGDRTFVVDDELQ